MEAYFFEYKLDEKAQKFTKRVQAKAEELTCKEAVLLMATVAVAVTDSTVQLHSSQIPYVQRTTFRIGPNEASVNFGWRY